MKTPGTLKCKSTLAGRTENKSTAAVKKVQLKLIHEFLPQSQLQ